ncbi:MAG: hypothetical protein COA73_11550 [Candidatus Hydrogenedentota bacterium]|nr:MAG: hypothetical protein COA73_11550 [Candidatus Hydrogenedentota bacterium]
MGYSYDSSVGGMMGVWKQNGEHFGSDAKASMLGLLLSMDDCGVNWRTWIGAPEQKEQRSIPTEFA